jgi:hypothetical protein
VSSTSLTAGPSTFFIRWFPFFRSLWKTS